MSHVTSNTCTLSIEGFHKDCPQCPPSTVHFVTICVLFVFSSDTNPSAHELVILHTSEAQEWATYLQHTLKSSKKFRKFSILPFAVDSTDQLHGYSFEHFQSCKCIVLLLSGAFLDFLYQSELQGALQGLLYPPHRVVVLLCGVTENDISTVGFQDWQSWRKVFAEDEPAVYVSTILDSIADGMENKLNHSYHHIMFIINPNKK